MADEDATLAGAKRKLRSTSGHDDAIETSADPLPLPTPSKRTSSAATARAKSPSLSVAASDSATSSPSSPLVIARSPSDTSRLWATRIAATQRIARRRGGGVAANKTSAATAKRRALSLSSAAASFEASVSITTSVLPKTKIETPQTTPQKRRRASTSNTQTPIRNQARISRKMGDVDVDMTEEDDAVSTVTQETEDGSEPAQSEPAENDLVGDDLVEDDRVETDLAENDRAEYDRAENDRAENDRVETGVENDLVETKEAEEPELVECKVEIKAEAEVVIKLERDVLHTLPKQRRRSVRTSGVNGGDMVQIDDDGDAEMAGEVDTASTATHEAENEVEPAQFELMEDARVEIGVQTDPVKSKPAETELLECKVEIKAEPEVIIKLERQMMHAERPPLAPSPSRRRSRVTVAEAEGATDAATTEQSTVEPTSSIDVDELTERLAALTASLAAEQAEKDELKREVDALASRLRDSEEQQQRLESKVASLTAALGPVKLENA